MYACILIPRELSLVLTLHPNPLHVLEMSATVWSNSHLPPGTVFYPDEGEVRLDRIETRTVIREDDIRRVYGCYDAIMNINGQDVRHCNWVRFVKTTNDPEAANIISSKVRGHSFYQVTRPIKPNEEIIVLFHLTAERSLYDRVTTSAFTPSSPMFIPPLSYHDIHTPLLLRHNREEPTGLITSTPLSLTKPKREESDITSTKIKSLLFNSSSSSSSFTSSFAETPKIPFNKRNIPHDSSLSSPMFTSSSSSRETTGSEDHSATAAQHASSIEQNSNEMNDNDNTPENNSDTEEHHELDKNSYQPHKHVDESDMSMELQIDEDAVNDNNCNDDPKGQVVDSTMSGNGSSLHGNGDEHKEEGEDVCEDAEKMTSVNNVSNDVPVQESHTSIPKSVVYQSLETEKPTPDGQITSSTNPILPNNTSLSSKQLGQRSDQENDPLQVPLKSSTLNSFSHETIKQEIEDVSISNRKSKAWDSRTEDCQHEEHFEEVVSSLPGSESNGNQTDHLFSSPNETRSLLCNIPGSPERSRPMDVHPISSRDAVPLKRCRERTWWPCEVCGKKFDRPSLLKRHTRTHTGEKPHACDVCGKAFSTSSSLNTHRRIHSGEKPHQCKICGKRFTASSNLYYHRMTHNKEKPHKCDLCSKSFPTPGDLRSHMYIHNGSWPFRCNVCNRGFSKQTNLKNHMLLHSGDKPHECPRCSKKFALLCNLKTHLKTHDNSDSSDSTGCVKCGVALEQPEEIRENLCNLCLETTRRIFSKTPSMLSTVRQKRHTDFSISKLTSTDVKKDRKESDPKQDKPRVLLTSSLNSGKVLSPTAPAFMPSSQSQQIHPLYRQFFAAAAEQHRWLAQPPTSQQIISAPSVPAHLKPPNFALENCGGQSKQSISKLGSPSPTHPIIPGFIPPGMMALRGGNFSPSMPTIPPGFTLHPGTGPWTGQVIAQGF